MSILKDVYNLGGDAVKNMFDVEFGDLPTGIGNATAGYTGLKSNSKCYRTKTFGVPSVGITTYDIDYKSVKIKMPGGKLDYEPKFTTELRIDRYWNVYKDLVKWRNYLASPATGAIGADTAANRCSYVNVISAMQGKNATAGLTTKDVVPHVWRFTLVFPMTVGEIGFDYSAGDNVTMSVDFGFIEMQDYHDDGLFTGTATSAKEVEDYDPNGTDITFK